MTISAKSIIDRVSVVLQDVTNIRWPVTELIDWLNDGQRDVALYKPNAFVQNIDVTLVPGTKQTIPADGNSLVSVVRNTNGYAIRLAAREILDAQCPDWHLPNKASARVVHYTYTEHNPKTFYVYPPSPGGNQVEIIYNAAPANCTIGGNLSIDDIYASPLVDYVLYRAYSKDSEYTTDEKNAASYYNSFLMAIKGKAGAEAATDPNANGKGNPNVI